MKLFLKQPTKSIAKIAKSILHSNSRLSTARIIAFTLFFLISISLPASDEFIRDLKQYTEKICKNDSRISGYEGCKNTAEFIKEELCEFRNIKILSQKFNVETPVYDNAYAYFEKDGVSESVRIYPLWPELVRLNTTPKEGISGRVVYCGNASLENLPGKNLKDGIAIMEMSSYSEWQNPFMMGAKALLLLANEDEEVLLPGEQPIFKPRFYVKDKKVSDFLRQGKISELTIKSSGKWRSAKGENIYALIKGSNPELTPMVIISGYDSMSIVPQLSPGADSAVDAAFVLSLAKYFNSFPPQRNTLFIFCDAMYMNNLGPRIAFATLACDENDNTRAAYLKMEKKILFDYEKITALINDFKDDNDALEKISDKSHYKEIQRYCKDELSPEIIGIREKNGILRLKISQASPNKDEIQKELNANLERLEFLNKTLLRLINGKKANAKIANDERNRIEAFALEIYRKAKKRIIEQQKIQENRIRFFEENDKVRREIIRFFTGKEDSPNLFSFVMAINLSDSGTLVGPALYCHQAHSNDKDIAEEFNRWIRYVISDGKKLKAEFSSEKLFYLGLSELLNKNIIERFLKIDNSAQLRAEFLDKLSKEFPEIDKAKIDDISKEISTLQNPSKKEIEEILFKYIPETKEKTLQSIIGKIMNISAIEGREIPESFSYSPTFLPTSAARSFRLKGVTWATLEGTPQKTDTAQDTFEKINWAKLSPQALVTALVMDLLLNDVTFSPQPLNISGMPRWRMPHGSIVSESVAETVPRTPMPDFLTVLTSNDSWRGLNNVRGVRGHDFVKTQIDGSFRFYPYPSPHQNWVDDRRKVQSFKLGDDGKIIKGLSDSTSMISGNMESLVRLRSKAPLNPLRRIAFDCIELNGPVIFDPRYQNLLKNFTLIDPVRGGNHKRAHFSIFRGQTFGLIPPESKWQLIIRSGLQKNRMIFMNVSEEKIQEKDSLLAGCIRDGFPAEQSIPSIPELQSAQDMFLIDFWRLRQLENAGITVPAIRAIHEETSALLKKSKDAYENNEGALSINYARKALANEIRAYHAIQSQSDDVTRGVIFLLILLVPFSVAMERLLFASVKINNQIILSLAIFAIMLGILWSFHPGFRISSQPLVILIAFLILILSIAVIIIVMNKFKSTLDDFRRGSSTEGLGASSSKATVIWSALWLGIANMRKRILRTILTATTIVMITFALLCFTSSSTYNDKRIYNLDLPASEFQTGIFIQHPALRQLDNRTITNVKLFLENKFHVCGRYWLASTNPSWRLIVRNSQNLNAVSLKAALFLAPEEKLILKPQSILRQWDAFEKGKGCYISKKTAELLQASVHDAITVAGFDFRILDIYDPQAIEALRKLDGQSVLPIDYSLERDNSTMSQEALEGQVSATGELEKDVQLNFCSADDIIILPESYAKKMNAQLRAVAAHIPPEFCKTIAEKLMRIIVYPVYYNEGDFVRAIVSTPLIPRTPAKIFIPIIIASLIIFNTMLNSVAERKNEIHIYTSLGLAPYHVGILFLAESATYGLMGTVFGYIIGQGLAKFLNSLNLMGSITLNYSGTAVIFTMGLVLAVVMLSAIVPAIMAAKIANPSEESDWKVPKPVNDEINDLLPFTVTKKTAKAIAFFIYEYIEVHKDGAIGNFTSDRIVIHGKEQESIASVSATVWLAPYDLGVRQEIKIEITPDEGEICSIRIKIARQSGQERTWWRLNKVFLSDLRRQLLGWRKIPTQKIIEYIEKAQKVFENA